MNSKFPDFVSLDEFIPEIRVQADYSTQANFTGRIVPGYKVKKALLDRQVASALLKVQEEALGRGLSLKVFDAYRPVKAVAFFKEWSHLPEDNEIIKNLYYPRFKRSELFEQGFLSSESTHSKGAAIDLTLITLSNGRELDMGSRFDFFDEISYTESQLISSMQRENRHLLKELMEEFGFINFSKEWWHYSFLGNKHLTVSYDFDIE